MGEIEMNKSNCKDNKIIDKLAQYRNNNKIVRSNEEREHSRVKANKNPHNDEMFEDHKYDNLDWRDEPVVFEKKSYIFCNFTNCKFGKKAVLDESRMYHTSTSFWNVTFENCIFENVYFEVCYFWNCIFKNCQFTEYKVVFERCCFRNIKTIYNEDKKEHETYYSSSEFINCQLTGIEWRECFGDNLIFEGNTLMHSAFKDCEMPGVIMKDNMFYSTYFNNCDIKDLSIIGMRYADLEFHFTEKSKDICMHKNIYVGKMDAKYLNKHEDYEIVSKFYYTLLEYLGMRNIDTHNMSEYRYRYNYYSMKAKHWWEQSWDRISWLLCGYGEKLWRFVVAFLSIIIIPAIGYLLCGLQIGSELYPLKYNIGGEGTLNLINFLEDVGKCLHFSIVTFSTVGYGNIVPYGWSYVISAVQILMGLVFVAVFTSVVLKKILK